MSGWPWLLLAAALALWPTARGGASARLRHHLEARRRAGVPAARGDGRCADAAGVFDLLAACLRAGMPPAGAVRVVAPHAPPQLAAALLRSADLHGLGASPEVAWDGRAGPPEAAALAKAVRRSSSTGTNLADALAELAAQARADNHDRAQAAAERAGVLIAAPLGLCFLPAFLCLGVVPVVAGLGAQMLGAGWR